MFELNIKISNLYALLVFFLFWMIFKIADTTEFWWQTQITQNSQGLTFKFKIDDRHVHVRNFCQRIWQLGGYV